MGGRGRLLGGKPKLLLRKVHECAPRNAPGPLRRTQGRRGQREFARGQVCSRVEESVPHPPHGRRRRVGEGISLPLSLVSSSSPPLCLPLSLASICGASPSTHLRPTLSKEKTHPGPPLVA